MKTIEEAAKELAEKNYHHEQTISTDIKHACQEMAQFIQRWIPFTKDIPDLKEEVILRDETKRRSKVIMRMVSKDAIKYASETYTHWRPIEFK